MMKKLLVLVLVFVSFGAYSQAFKDVNQKLYFKNATKFGDTLFVDSASVLGSGQFLKIADTTASNWRVIKGNIPSSLFDRASNKITPKNAGDSLEAAGLDLNGLSGIGNELRIGDDNRVYRAQIDTSFFSRAGGTIQPKTESDNFTLGSSTSNVEFNMFGVQRSSRGVGALDNGTGGLKTLVLSDNMIDSISYSGPRRVMIDSLSNAKLGAIYTIVGSSAVPDDSAAIFQDVPPFFLNGNDTLKQRDVLQLLILRENEYVEISRSDN